MRRLVWLCLLCGLLVVACGSQSSPYAGIMRHGHVVKGRLGAAPPGNPAAGDILFATTGKWSGSPTGFSYAWEDCDSGGANCTTAAGTPTDTQRYQIVSGDAGSTIRVQVTASYSGHPNASVLSPPTGVVSSGGTAPSNSVAPYFTSSTGGASCTAGCAVQGQALSVTTGTWTCSGGCGTLTYAYQWQRCTTTAGQPPTTGSCTNISGATSSSYTTTSSDLGKALSVAVTASNNGTAGTATSATGTGCSRGSLAIPGTGDSASGTSGAATPNDPAGCSPISAVVATTQAGEKFCTNSPITCGYPDYLVPGNVGPTGALTTVTGSCGCLPSGASTSGGDLTISGNNVTVQNVKVTGSLSITGTNDTFSNSEVDSGTSNITGTGMLLDHDWFQGDANWNINNSGDGRGTISHSFFNNGCEDLQNEGMTASDNYLLDNKFFSGCHFEDTYTGGGTSQAGTPATDFEHNTAICNFPDNWCMFLDDHAFSATGAYNVTINNTLIANDGFYSYGGTTINGGTNNVVTNNRISQAYQANGGSLGTDGWGVGNSCAGTTYTNNIYDDTLAATAC